MKDETTYRRSENLITSLFQYCKAAEVSAFDFLGALPHFPAAFVGEFLDFNSIFARAL